jgi:hypothetical protein
MRRSRRAAVTTKQLESGVKGPKVSGTRTGFEATDPYVLWILTSSTNPFVYIPNPIPLKHSSSHGIGFRVSCSVDVVHTLAFLWLQGCEELY